MEEYELAKLHFTTTYDAVSSVIGGKVQTRQRSKLTETLDRDFDGLLQCFNKAFTSANSEEKIPLMSEIAKCKHDYYSLIFSDVDKDAPAASELKTEPILSFPAASTISEAVVTSGEPKLVVPESIVLDPTAVLGDTLVTLNIKIEPFHGDPLRYHDFIESFRAQVDQRKTLPANTKMSHLLQVLGGPAKASVEGLPIDRAGYTQALSILADSFGSKERVSRAHINRLQNGHPIKAHNVKHIQALYHQLLAAQANFQRMDFWDDINSSPVLLKIVSRLPDYLQNKWQRRVYQVRETGERPSLKHLVKFIEIEYKIENDAVWSGHQRDNKRQVSVSIASTTVSNCIFCEGKHLSRQCDKPPKRDVVFSKAKEAKVCYKCFGSSHRSDKCNVNIKCSICKKDNHHTFLHSTPTTRKVNVAHAHAEARDSGHSPGTEAVVESTSSAGPSVETSVVVANTTTPSSESFLPIVKVKVRGTNGSIETNALLDSGSSISIICSKLASKLGLEGVADSLTISNVLGSCETRKAKRVSLRVVGANNFETNIPEVWTLKDFSLPCGNKSRQNFYADDPTVEIDDLEGDIKVLIGTNATDMLIPLKSVSLPDKPTAIQTKLGWTLMGGEQCTNISSVYSVLPKPTLEYQWDKFWTIDDLHEKYLDVPYSQQDLACKRTLSEAKLVDGHYQVGLLWKDNRSLPNNRSQALSRLEPLRRHFLRDGNYRQQYTEIMEGYVNKGFASVVQPLSTSSSQNCGRIWYLPHHAVFHPVKKKMRVVFDAAAKFKGVSLNDCLFSGPDLLNNLLGCLLRFRQSPVALMADVEAMYHQVLVNPEDRDVLRFLWWKNGNPENEVQELRMNSHVFGAISSPCCAITALNKTADDNKEIYGEKVCNVVKQQMYMDDCLTSVESVNEAVDLCHSLTDMLSKGGFKLTKWVSNRKAVLEQIPEAEWSKGVLSLDKEGSFLERVLGVGWSVCKDEICFCLRSLDKPLTKRGVLSLVSGIYNPDGFLAPILLQPKLIMRELWRQKVDWDDPLPNDQLVIWKEWLRSLPAIEGISYPRCYRGQQFHHSSYRTELHVFGDASSSAFGAVAYLRFSHENDIVCNFVVGKARCAPIDAVTIPRLELQAAVLASKVGAMLNKELEIPIDETYFWSDSRTALAYIQNSHRRFKVFVANRVAEIRENSNVNQWYFCPGELNPADVASRGVSPCEFVDKPNWVKGPEFLCHPRSEWPKQPEQFIPDEALELKGKQVAATVTVTPVAMDTLVSKFSSYNKMKRVLARWLIYMDKCKGLQEKEMVIYLEKAELLIVKHVQSKEYARDIVAMQKTKAVLKSSPLNSLCPFLDEQGIIRVGGRLKHADLPRGAKHPVIIPAKCQLSFSIIQDAHSELAHTSVNTIVAEIRQRFWIPHLKTAVKSHSKKCILCRKLAARRSEQLMADLPVPRVTQSSPFDRVGVDFFGPMLVKVRRSTEKRWGCIFTCLATRAVHLETSSSLDTDRFILVLRRFQARRGHQSEIISDNGTNFVGAEREIREAINNWNHSCIQSHLQQAGTKWTFHPPAAAHFGGVWERLIRCVKRSLRAILRQQIVDQEVLDTIFCDVERILNSRPLTSISDDPSDLEPLTPNHFLISRASIAHSPGVFISADVLHRKRWRKSQALVNAFWKRWHREYLQTLQQRCKWTKKCRNFQIGDLVLICDDNVSRGQWPMGVIQAVSTAADGLVRSALVKTANTNMTRPIAKLCLLEANEA